MKAPRAGWGGGWYVSAGSGALAWQQRSAGAPLHQLVHNPETGERPVHIPWPEEVFFFFFFGGKVTANREGSWPLRVPSSGCTAGWFVPTFTLDSKVAAIIAVPSIDPRGLVVSLAACVPTFLAFWLVYRHGTLQMLAAFGSRHQSHQSSGGYVGRSQWS